MSVNYEKYNPEELPPEELSAREKALLNTQLNQERVRRWKQLAGPKPNYFQSMLTNKWVWMALIFFLLTLFCWQKGWFLGSTPTKDPIMASRTDILEYPFDNITVRGKSDAQGLIIPSKSLEAYRKKDFNTALQLAGATNHFFNGICWLQLKDAQKAMGEFDQIPSDGSGIGDEFYYYKGIALQDLGRKDEAKKAFQRVLDSRTIRQPYRTETMTRIGN